MLISTSPKPFDLVEILKTCKEIKQGGSGTSHGTKTEPNRNRKNKTETGPKISKTGTVPIFLNPKNQN